MKTAISRDARLDRALEALLVGHEHRVAHARRLADPPEDLLRVGELRHRARRDERADLDGRQSRLRQQVHERDARLDRDRLRLVLETVARPDLVDGDALGQMRPADRVLFPGIHCADYDAEWRLLGPTCSGLRTSVQGGRSPPLTPLLSSSGERESSDLGQLDERGARCRPGRPRGAAAGSRVPSRGARIECSIFIASRIRRTCPRCTVSPSATRVLRIRPGIGASRSPSSAPPRAGAPGAAETRTRRRRTTRRPGPPASPNGPDDGAPRSRAAFRPAPSSRIRKRQRSPSRTGASRSSAHLADLVVDAGPSCADPPGRSFAPGIRRGEPGPPDASPPAAAAAGRSKSLAAAIQAAAGGCRGTAARQARDEIGRVAARSELLAARARPSSSGRFVSTPSTTQSSSARRARSIAAGRSVPETTSLASRGSKSSPTFEPRVIPASTRTPGPEGSSYSRTVARARQKRRRVLCVEPQLDRVSSRLQPRPPIGQAAAGGDLDLRAHEVDAERRLRDRVLDLEPRVHLEEVEVALLVEEELDRSGADVADRAAGFDRGLRHAAAQRGVERRARASPRGPSGGAAARCTPARRGASRARPRLRRSGTRRGAAARGASRDRPSRRRTPRPPAAAPRRGRPAGLPRGRRATFPCRRRRPPP